jgi:hypothetical protein
VFSYRVLLDVPAELVLYVAELLGKHRREIGTRRGTRALSCWRQAIFALAWFRDRPDVARLGRGFGISQATAYRYLGEAIEVLTARAPDLREALERAKADGLPYLILDGKVVAADRLKEKTTSKKGREIDRWYSGKAHGFGGNIQALFTPSGVPLWVSPVLPGGVHDITAAPRARPCRLAPLADGPASAGRLRIRRSGDRGACPGEATSRRRELDINARTRNALLRSLRCLGERGFALISQRWRTLQRVMLSPGKIGDIAQAALVLVQFEHRMIT